ncbi:MAG: hypothetical protein RDU20_12480 [Desulfomonilaceae bacterium]|nr:hypothetical protein [Desulfomonilaceae bacterium]
MSEKPDLSELLKRKFEPVSGWKPATTAARPMSSVKGIVSALERTLQTVEQNLGPFSDEAKAKMREVVGTVGQVADKSGTEARTALSKALAVLAERIKP